MISAVVVADSISPANIRLTTFILKYPRMIHAEVMTHRVFSRNAASSRAIPVKKIIERIKEDPSTPIHFGLNQPGMQARQEVSDLIGAQERWGIASRSAITQAECFLEMGVHKQVANRVLEPFMTMEVILTATDWDNFYALRIHPDAQPEMNSLALAMLKAHNSSTPKRLRHGEWHLPLVTNYDATGMGLSVAQKCSVARCARVSYLNHEGKTPTLEQDLYLYDRLVGASPIHASAAEHQATPFSENAGENPYSNLRGWLQYRKTIPQENIYEYPGLIKHTF